MAQLQLSPAVWLQTQALSSVGLLWSWAFVGNIIDCSVAQVCLVSDSATPWTVACQAPWSMKFSRQEYWSGLPFPTLGDLPDQGIKPKSLASPALAGRFFITAPPGKPSPYQRYWLSLYLLLLNSSSTRPLLTSAAIPMAKATKLA